MTYEAKRQRERVEERRKINTDAPLEALEKIARDHVPGLIGRQNGLDTLDSDELDFCEVSVWGLKEALIEAYLLGKKDGYRDADADLQKRVYKLAFEAKGLTPPLMAGDKVYQTDGVQVYESTISNVIYETKEGIAFNQDAIDSKSVLLSRDEAEKKLKEAEG